MAHRRKGRVERIVRPGRERSKGKRDDVVVYRKALKEASPAGTRAKRKANPA